MATLIIAEHDNQSLKAVNLNLVNAASRIGGEVHLLVAGYGCQVVADSASKITGVGKVLLADSAVYEHQLAENMSQLIVDLAKDYSHLVAPATTMGKNIMPRVAALLDVAQISDVIRVDSDDTFARPIYAGNAIATVKSLDRIKVMTVRGSSFDGAAEQDLSVVIEVVDSVYDAGISNLIAEQVVQSERPELTAANVIVSGGRGMGNGENFSMLDEVADKLGAAVGASRAAVDAGFVPNDMQVGQTGKIVAPDLYIAVGISGAIQHLAGMKDSKVIVAINKDEEAPIFQVADYGLVTDLFVALPDLADKL
ncbi:electron transfer flavoprotein subunit alpha/FixB family protein [Amphritea opalescens]|uniref:Electron transfer flavoprotein subunit alpha n=1 Tax=Amphritea opalescens TaxID=2490544 RepID=A0A430KUY8_9GAMM|nr:FAD-binding protein [Amphritea opalescens]RTE67317.1 electron transfer flavoprotein subunit alpha/FixB family protein [Amphritea opalescens]